MAWKSFGRDAVNRNTNPLEWLERESPHKLLTCRITPQFHEDIKKYCQESHIEVSSLTRLLLSGELKQNK